MFIISFIFIVLSPRSLFAKEVKDWKKVTIPGAYCGNGKSYHVFTRVKDKQKLLVTLGSGGACWNKTSCYGPNIRAWIKPTKKKAKTPIFVKKSNIFDKHSFIYFPYCTGDTWSGSHIAKYKKKTVHHYGYTNVKKTIEYLEKKGIFDFSEVKDFLIYGSSAGAIGGLIHTKTFEDKIQPSAKKVLIADSPGLHFGPKFWDRFSNQSRADFKRSFDDINFNAPLDNGFVAPYMREACNSMSGWRVGFIMGSKDLVMSRIFGKISIKKHHKLVYSHEGFANKLNGNKTCSIWLKKSRIHTFLQGFPTYNKKVNGVSALNYVLGIYQKRSNKSYIDDPS